MIVLKCSKRKKHR